MKADRGLLGSWMIWPALAMIAAFFLFPAGAVIDASLFDPEFSTQHFRRLAEQPVYVAVFVRTLAVSLLVALVCGILGFLVAYHIVRQRAERQAMLIFLVLLPMWMSVLVRSYAWMVILGREGVVNSALLGLGFASEPATLLFTSGAVYVAMVQILLPIQVVTCYGTMRDIDLNLVRAARVLGASSWQATRRVFLPLSFDGVITGMTIVFMLSMGFFITPALVGGRKDLMLANLIEFNVSQLNWGFASALGVLLLAGTVVSALLVRKSMRYFSRVLV